MSNTGKKQSIFDINTANMTQEDMLILGSDSVIETNMTPSGSPKHRNEKTEKEAQEKRDILLLFINLSNQKLALERQLKILTHSLEKEIKLLEDLQEKHQEITRSLREKLTEMDSARESLAEVQSEISTLRGKSDALENEINQIETEYNTLQEEIDSLAAKSEAQVEIFDKLSPEEQQEWIKSGKAQSDASASKALLENDFALENLKQQKECFEKILLEKKDAFDATKDHIQKLEEETAILNADLMDNENNQKTCKRRITKFKDSISDIKTQISEINAQLNHVNIPLSCTIPETSPAYIGDGSLSNSDALRHTDDSPHIAFNIAAGGGTAATALALAPNNAVPDVTVQTLKTPEIQASTPLQEDVIPTDTGKRKNIQAEEAVAAPKNIRIERLTIYDLSAAQTDIIAAEITRFAETIRKVEAGEMTAPAHMEILRDDFQILHNIQADKSLKINDATGQIDGASETLSTYLLKKLDIAIGNGKADVTVAEDSQDAQDAQTASEGDKDKDNPENPAMKPDPNLLNLAERKNTLAAIAAGQMLGISKEELALAAEELGITGRYFDMVFEDIRQMPEVKIIDPVLVLEDFNIAAPGTALRVKSPVLMG